MSWFIVFFFICNNESLLATFEQSSKLNDHRLFVVFYYHKYNIWAMSESCFVMKKAKKKQHAIFRSFAILLFPVPVGERGGSVVECRTPEREVRGSRPTAAVLCPWARHFTPRKYWLITQEAMAPSRYDWKIVDWDVKPQHNQPTKSCPSITAHDRCTFDRHCEKHGMEWNGLEWNRME